ncbi:MAG: polysaccharide biosynthesis protein, partial [Bacteroidales bacterium]|nr:polysaccharide biosynthesis protein [Bacteroidales bacterium]
MGIVIRQSLKATSVNYAGVLLGIFTTFCIMTKYLDPDVIGLTRVLYEVAYVTSMLAMMGAPSSGMRFFPYFKDEKTGHHGFFYYYLLLPVVGCLLCGVLYLAFKTPIIEYFGKKDHQFGDFFYYVIPLFVVLTFWQFFEAYANIHMRIAIPKLVREVGMRVLMLG